MNTNLQKVEMMSKNSLSLEFSYKEGEKFVNVYMEVYRKPVSAADVLSFYDRLLRLKSPGKSYAGYMLAPKFDEDSMKIARYGGIFLKKVKRKELRDFTNKI